MLQGSTDDSVAQRKQLGLYISDDEDAVQSSENLFEDHFLEFKDPEIDTITPVFAAETLIQMVTDLKNRFQYIVHHPQQIQRFMNLDNKQLTMPQLRQKRSEWEHGFFAIAQHMQRSIIDNCRVNLIDHETPSHITNKNNLQYCIRTMKWCMDNISQTMIQNHLSEGPDTFNDKQLWSEDIVTPDRSNYTPKQQLLDNVLGIFYEKNYRRYNGKVYEEIKVWQVEDSSHNIRYEIESSAQTNLDDSCLDVYRTHAWGPVNNGNNDISSVLYQLCHKQEYKKNWFNLTRVTPQSIIKHLENVETQEFPTLKPDRCVRSFYNGVIIFRGPGDYEFRSFMTHDHIPTSIVACKFLPTEFDPSILGYHNYMNIPTPYFDSILDHQRWNILVKNQIFTQLGRTFFDLNSHDNWECIPFFKGVAGSGKSTIGRLMQKFYNMEDVGILSSNMEGQFGLEPIHDKLIYMCLEVTNTFKLNRADFQSMISGEEVSVAAKHKTARIIKWNAPGLFFGNELGPWTDSADSLTRRLMVFELNYRVPPHQKDTQLDKKLEKELPNLLYKMIQSYFTTIEHCANKSIWDIVPKYIQNTQKKIGINTNAIKNFIHMGQSVIKNTDDTGEDNCMLLWEFNELFKEWLPTSSFANQNYDYHQYTDILQQCGLTVREIKDRGQYIFGLKKVGQYDKHMPLRDLFGDGEVIEHIDQVPIRTMLETSEPTNSTLLLTILSGLNVCTTNPYVLSRRTRVQIVLTYG